MTGRPVKLRIRELRARFGGMSQAELAKLTGLSTVSISNLESERIKRIELETIGKLCTAFNCTPSELFELPPLSEEELVARQKRAILRLMGSINYGLPDDENLDPRKIDADLVDYMDKELKSSTLRVADKTESYKAQQSLGDKAKPTRSKRNARVRKSTSKRKDG